MCTGIMVERQALPDQLCDAEIVRRVVSPHAQATPLVQFLYRQARAALPVWWDGELRILPWQVSGDRSRRLDGATRTNWSSPAGAPVNRRPWRFPPAWGTTAASGIRFCRGSAASSSAIGTARGSTC